MKKQWLSHLSAIALSAALLLPCVFTASAMAASDGYDPLYSWTPSASTTKLDCAQTLANNSVPRTGYEPIDNPTNENYGYRSNNITTFTMYTENGPVSKRFHSMYVGAYSTGGLDSVLVTDGTNSRRKTTEALEVTLAALEEEPIGSSEHEAIALTHLMGVRTEHKTEGSMLWERNATYTVHTTLGSEWTVQGVRSWTLECPAMYKNGSTEARAVIYRVTSNNLLVDTNGVTHTLAANEQIDKIVYQPYGESTSLDRDGCFHVSDVEVRGYTDQTDYEQEFPVSASYTDVPAETLRSIVLAEADVVRNISWTPTSTLNGYSGVTYAAGVQRKGAIYQRAATNPNDPYLMLSTESFLDLVNSNTYENHTYPNEEGVDVALASGMDCSTFVYNAISRVSTTMAYTNMLYERDNSLVRLGDLVPTDDQPKFTDGDIINNTENTKDEVFAAYAQLKKGDVVNKFVLNTGSVHAMLVYETPAAGATSVKIVEQTSSSGSNTTNNCVEYWTFEKLYEQGYVPYTLRQYTDGTGDGMGQVENANVQIKVHPADPYNWAGGVKVAVASNYRLLHVNAQLKDSSDTSLASFAAYGYRAMSEHMFLDTGDIDAKLATLPTGEYTLTVSVESGPKTTVGGTTPVTTESVTFTVVNDHVDCAVHTTGTALTGSETGLSAGTYYLTGDITATSNLTISGEVTLCLNGYTLTAPAAGGNFITVQGGAKLTICGGHGGSGVISGNSAATANAHGLLIGGNNSTTNDVVTLNSGTITGFVNTSATNKLNANYGGGVYMYGAAQFIMNGGTISGNSAARGAGVAINQSATFTMNGGTITDNTTSSASYGAGVQLLNASSKCYLKGGSIIGNNTGKWLVKTAGTLEITGGTFDGNPSTYVPAGYVATETPAGSGIWVVTGSGN